MVNCKYVLHPIYNFFPTICVKMVMKIMHISQSFSLVLLQKLHCLTISAVYVLFKLATQLCIFTNFFLSFLHHSLLSNIYISLSFSFFSLLKIVCQLGGLRAQVSINIFYHLIAAAFLAGTKILNQLTNFDRKKQ